MKGTHYTSTTLLKSVAAILRNKHGSLVTTDRNLGMYQHCQQQAVVED
jgi:hypothetical protein